MSEPTFWSHHRLLRYYGDECPCEARLTELGFALEALPPRPGGRPRLTQGWLLVCPRCEVLIQADATRYVSAPLAAAARCKPRRPRP